jgi:signal transduction histidine kinase
MRFLKGLDSMKLIYKFYIAIVLVLGGLLGTLTVINIPKVTHTINKLEKDKAKEVLDKAYLIIKCGSSRIEGYKAKALQYHKDQLKVVSKMVYYILQFHYESYKNGWVSKEEAKRRAFERIAKIRYGKNGYVFLLNDSYHIVSHPNKEFINKNMYNEKDTKGNYYVREMVDKTRVKGESFTRYWWPKIKGKEFEKLSYTKLFKPWKIYIGTGVYIDDINKEVALQTASLKEKLQKIMANTHIGKNGYIYVFDKTGRMIVHPNKKILGDIFRKIRFMQTGNLLYKDLIKSYNEHKPFRYKWNRLDDPEHYVYEKISWLKYEPKMGWYVASSIYVDDLKLTSRNLMKSIIFYGILSILITFIIAMFLTKKVLSPLELLTDAIKNIKKGNYHTRVDINRSDEFGELAKGFNSMAQTVEDNITDLDKTVKLKTQKLLDLNEQLEHKVQQAIEETKHKEKMLQKQSRLAQMGEMISMIAHQWRQPLGAISSSIIAIQSKLAIGKFDLSQEDSRKEFLVFLEKKHKAVNEYVQTLSDTIDDFRNFFKPDKQTEIVVINEPIMKALKIIQVSIENKGIAIYTDFKVEDTIEM